MKTAGIAQATFPNARVYQATEIDPGFAGIAIDLGQCTYIVYQQDEATDQGDRWWTLDVIAQDDTATECHRTLAIVLGSILTYHLTAIFAV